MKAGLAASPAAPYLGPHGNLSTPVEPPRRARRPAHLLVAPQPRPVIGATLAVLVTIIILILFFVDSKINTAPRRTVQYVDSWPADRTDAEIVAQQKKDQAEAEARAKARQEEFKKLEKTLGM